MTRRNTMQNLKIIIALMMLSLTVYAGFTHQSYECLPLLSLMFTVAYIDNKFSLWLDTLKHFGLVGVVIDFLITYFIQGIVVSVLYLLSFSISGTFFARSGISLVSKEVYWLASITLVIIILLRTWTYRSDLQ